MSRALVAVALVLAFAAGAWAQTQPLPVTLATGIVAAVSAANVVIAGVKKLVVDTADVVTASAYCYRWTSSTDASGTKDAGLCRAAAASVTVSNGTTGPAAFSTAGTALGLAVPVGSIGIATSATTTVGNTGQGGRLVVVCGPTAGTASLLFYAGTTNVPVVLANAVGGGLIGC